MPWAIAFLASTSATVYERVAKVMMLPNIRYVQKKSAELIPCSCDKGCSMHLSTIKSMQEQYGPDIGVISLDSANAKAGYQHDHISNTFKGGCKSHKLAHLTQMFHGVAESVKKVNENLPSFEGDEEAQNAQSKKSVSHTL